MAQLCNCGIGECSGCGFCFGGSVRCAVCGKDIDASREKYYIFRGDAASRAKYAAYAETGYAARTARVKAPRLPRT